MSRPTNLRIEGRVFPESCLVTIPGPNLIHRKDERGFLADFDFKIVAGNIQVDCYGELLSENDFERCAVYAFEYATALVDTVAFSRASSLSVILDALILPDGTRKSLGFAESDEVKRIGMLATDCDFTIIKKLVTENFDLRFALRDLVSSLGALNYTAIASARSMETIRRAIAPPELSERDAWADMRQRLKIDRNYRQMITDASRGPRHGNRSAIGSTEEITRRSWEIMGRFFEFLRRGGVAELSESEFPLLTERSVDTTPNRQSGTGE